MNQLNPEINQWNHQYSVLLANQPGVPQATPAPGFEQRLLMAAPSQLLEQQICASTMPGTKDRSYYVGSYSENFTRHTRKFSLRKHQNWKQSWHTFFLQLPLYVVFKPSLPLFQVMTTKKTNLIFSTANQMMPPLMSNWPKPPCEVCEVYTYFLLCISCRDKSIILPSFCCNRILAYFGCETNSLHNLIGSSVRRGFNALKAHEIISQ